MRARVLLPLLALSCAELDDPSTIKDLRLLAAALEPPEVILDQAAPAAIDLRLTPLVVDRTDRPVTFTLRACGNDPLAPAGAGAGASGTNYPAGGARSSVGSARCPPDGPLSWTLPVVPANPGGFAVTLPRALIDAAFAADVFPGHLGVKHGGFDLGLPIAFELSAAAGDEVVVGIKRLIVWQQPIDARHRPNQNPRITTLVGYRERDVTTLLPTTPELPIEDAPLELHPGEKLWIEPRGAVAEPYLTTIVDRFTDETQPLAVPAETLRFSFYATAGKFELPETTTGGGFGVTPGPRVALESRYVAPGEVPPAPVRIFVVVRDERGGASWVERALVVRRP